MHFQQSIQSVYQHHQPHQQNFPSQEQKILQQFLIQTLQNEELYFRALAICQQHCIVDIDTLLKLSPKDLEKIKFPLGIIKKLQPNLPQTSSFDEAIQIRHHVKQAKNHIEENYSKVQIELLTSEQKIQKLKQELFNEEAIYQHYQLLQQQLKIALQEFMLYEKLDTATLMYDYPKIQHSLKQINDVFKQMNMNFTKNYFFQSTLLKKKEDDQLFLQQHISQYISNFQSAHLLYKASRDGFGAQQFHRFCDNKGPTLTIVKIKNSGIIVGAFASQSWGQHTQKYIEGTLDESFLFCLHLKKIFKCKNPKYVYYQSINHGPGFGYNDFLLFDKSQTSLYVADFGNAYNSYNISKENFIGKSHDFTKIEVYDVEVFALSQNLNLVL